MSRLAQATRTGYATAYRYSLLLASRGFLELSEGRPRKVTLTPRGRELLELLERLAELLE